MPMAAFALKSRTAAITTRPSPEPRSYTMSVGPTWARRSIRSTISGGVTRKGASAPPGYVAQPAPATSRSVISARAVLGSTHVLPSMLSAVVSSLHLLALAVGLPAVFLRGRALKGRLDADGLRRLLASDNVWGIAALLWIVTGLLRAFAGLEKGTEFYLGSPLFWVKMSLFLLVLLLEIRPMMTFIRWRIKLGRAEAHDTSPAR